MAPHRGADADAFADAILADVLADDPDDLTPEEVTEIRAGIRRGLEAAAAGRVKPLSQAVSEARQRHGFRDSWASGAVNSSPFLSDDQRADVMSLR